MATAQVPPLHPIPARSRRSPGHTASHARSPGPSAAPDQFLVAAIGLTVLATAMVAWSWIGIIGWALERGR